MLRHKGRSVALVVALAMLVTACGDDDEDPPAAGGSGGTETTVAGNEGDEPEVAIDRTAILRYGGMQATALDPVNYGHVSGLRAQRLIFDTLLTYDDAGAELIPWLAEEFEVVSPNELRLTLHPDVVFQDDTPLDADAVAFNLNRALTDPDSILVSSLYMLESVEVVDELTVLLHLSEPAMEPLLHALASWPGMMASPTAVQAAGSSAAFNESPVGAGPYEFAGNFVPNETLSVRAWDGYWNPDAQLLGGVDIVAIPNADLATQLNALRSGEVDYTPLDGYAGIEAVEADPGLRLLVGQGEHIRALWLNESLAPFDDPEVRRALAYAVDREPLADVQTGGRGHPHYQYFVPSHPLYDPDFDQYAYDPDQAEEILRAAGYDEPVAFTMKVTSSSPDFVNGLTLIAAQLNEDGLFDASVEQLPPAQAFSLLFSGGPNNHGTVQATAINSLVANAGLDQFFRALFAEGGSRNMGGVELLENLDELLVEAAQADATEQLDLYGEIERQLLETDVSLIPLYTVPAVTGIQDYVGGVTRAHPRDGHPLDFPFRTMYITEGRVPAPDAEG